MEYTNKILTILITLILLSLLTTYGVYVSSIMGHEEAHKTINASCGAISYIEYAPLFILGENKTIPITGCTNENMYEQVKIMHTLNETISYQTTPILIGIMLLQVIMMICIAVAFIGLKR